MKKTHEKLPNLTPWLISEKVSVVIDTVESCPYCDSKSYQKWGVRSDLKRYRCNQWHKTFNALTGTPLTRVRHKEVWLDFFRRSFPE